MKYCWETDKEQFYLLIYAWTTMFTSLTCIITLLSGRNVSWKLPSSDHHISFLTQRPELIIQVGIQPTLYDWISDTWLVLHLWEFLLPWSILKKMSFCIYLFDFFIKGEAEFGGPNFIFRLRKASNFLQFSQLWSEDTEIG